jgi:hypothetical protein
MASRSAAQDDLRGFHGVTLLSPPCLPSVQGSAFPPQNEGLRPQRGSSVPNFCGRFSAKEFCVRYKLFSFRFYVLPAFAVDLASFAPGDLFTSRSSLSTNLPGFSMRMLVGAAWVNTPKGVSASNQKNPRTISPRILS